MYDTKPLPFLPFNDIYFCLFIPDINNTTGTSVHCHSKHDGPNGIYTQYLHDLHVKTTTNTNYIPKLYLYLTQRSAANSPGGDGDDKWRRTRLSLVHSLGGATSGCTATPCSKLCSGSDIGGDRKWFSRSVQDNNAGLADSFYCCTAISTWIVCKNVSEVNGTLIPYAF